MLTLQTTPDFCFSLVLLIPAMDFLLSVQAQLPNFLQSLNCFQSPPWTRLLLCKQYPVVSHSNVLALLVSRFATE
jgi:hypothetical protein